MWVCDDPRGFRHRGGAGCERPNQGRSVCNGVQSTTAMRPASAASRSGVHVMTMPLTVQASAHAHSSTTITSGEITMRAKKLLVIAVGLALIHGQSLAQDAAAPTPAPAKADEDKAVDRKTVVKGKRVSVRVDIGGRRLLKIQTATNN